MPVGEDLLDILNVFEGRKAMSRRLNTSSNPLWIWCCRGHGIGFGRGMRRTAKLISALSPSPDEG
jgi:hypothetical protein